MDKPIIKNTPLSTKIENGDVVIRIGIERLKYAFEHCEVTQWIDEEGDWEQFYLVSDLLELANDFISQVNREEKDGTTPLHLFLDKIFKAVLESGCAGIVDAPYGMRAKGFDEY